MNEDKILQKMQDSPATVKFLELHYICCHFFGSPRQNGSHVVFKTPWKGDPRINIQNDKGKAKTYQVRQVLSAIKQLRGSGDQ